jgi:hypothetical protein
MEFDGAMPGLPKWPQMRVWGPSITPKQAQEIIIRTDHFWQGGGGNDHDFQRRLCAAVDFPYMEYGDPDTDWNAYYEGTERFRTSIGYVNTEYVRNGWISNSFIFGPSGWCWPDGTIRFVHNVGKWPSVEEILEDWQAIAKAWPFLDLDACLMSGEGSEDNIKPVAIIQVKDGIATAHDPDTYEFLSRFGQVSDNFELPDLGTAVRSILMSSTNREQRWTINEVKEMVTQVRNNLSQS